MRSVLKKLRSMIRAEEGLAYLEFAIALPFLLALFMGSVEVTRYIIIAQKVEKSAVTISDVVAQSEEITTTELNQLISAVTEVMRPYAFGSNGYVVISAVSKEGTNPPVINWQYMGGGTWTHVSHVGTSGSTATLPNGLILNDHDTVIVAEVFYNYQPMTVNNGVITGREIYKVSIFKPRLGDLRALGT